MLERLLIAIALIIVGGVVYLAITWFQRRRATLTVRQERREGIGEQHAGRRARLLYFRSDTCPSCAAQSRLLQQLDDGVKPLIEKIDVDREQARARAYNVFTLPTTLVVDARGEVKHINYGVTSPRKLERQVAQAHSAD
jgi:hypothetical protein